MRLWKFAAAEYRNERPAGCVARGVEARPRRRSITRIAASQSPLMPSFAAMAMNAHTAPGQFGGHAVAQRRVGELPHRVDVVAALGAERRRREHRGAHRGRREIDTSDEVLRPPADAEPAVVDRLERERGDDAQRAAHVVVLAEHAGSG